MTSLRAAVLPFMGKDNDHPTDLVTRLKQHSGAIRVSELARILTMSRTTVYQLVEAGRIPHYRIGDSIRFDGVRVARWLAEQEIVA